MLSRGRRRKSGLRRALRWIAFVPIASRLPIYSRLIWALLKDNRIPATRKAILAGAVGYLFVGRDLVPDDIPVLGGIDDLAVVVLAVELFFEGVPDEILEEKCRELDIDGRSCSRASSASTSSCAFSASTARSSATTWIRSGG